MPLPGSGGCGDVLRDFRGRRRVRQGRRFNHGHGLLLGFRLLRLAAQAGRDAELHGTSVDRLDDPPLPPLLVARERHHEPVVEIRHDPELARVVPGQVVRGADDLALDGLGALGQELVRLTPAAHRDEAAPL